MNPVPAVASTAPTYLTIPAAIARTGLKKTRLFGLLAEGKLAARKAGRQTLIDCASLDSHMASLPVWRARTAN